jgi:hypothetical protein
MKVYKTEKYGKLILGMSDLCFGTSHFKDLKWLEFIYFYLWGRGDTIENLINSFVSKGKNCLIPFHRCGIFLKFKARKRGF